jgi:tagatose-1,6-bisphosphate aldolase non-catalytic subunit AgaZ/GatZ
MEFKLGFGPMSPLIVDTLCQYANSHRQPLMIIASRNQVDADSGYVMSTSQLGQQLESVKSEYIKLCRDHCGPYFLDSEKSLGIRAAIEATKKTIAADIENGFDLIHIDTSRCDNGYEVADELLEFCLRLKPDVEFEFGTRFDCVSTKTKDN